MLCAVQARAEALEGKPVQNVLPGIAYHMILR